MQKEATETVHTNLHSSGILREGKEVLFVARVDKVGIGEQVRTEYLGKQALAALDV